MRGSRLGSIVDNHPSLVLLATWLANSGKHATELGLTLNELSCKHMAVLSTGLSQLKRLRTLILWNNTLADDGTAAAMSISKLHNLTSLDLHVNGIGPEGAKALAQPCDVSEVTE